MNENSELLEYLGKGLKNQWVVNWLGDRMGLLSEENQSVISDLDALVDASKPGNEVASAKAIDLLFKILDTEKKKILPRTNSLSRYLHEFEDIYGEKHKCGETWTEPVETLDLINDISIYFDSCKGDSKCIAELQRCWERRGRGVLAILSWSFQCEEVKPGVHGKRLVRFSHVDCFQEEGIKTFN